MSQPSPFFSVIVPWHGNHSHLERALGSLRAQTFRDFEAIIVCNGAAVAQAGDLEQKLGSQLCRVVSIPHADASRARNAGIEAARGDWLAFLDVDDVFLPVKLERVAAAIRAEDADVFISRGLRVRSRRLAAVYPPELLEDGENLGEFFFCRGANCSATAIVAKREVAARVRFVDDLKKFEDNDFLIRAQASGARVRMLPDALYEWSDDSEVGRMSLGADYEAQRRWALALRPALSDRAYFGFLARRIAQYKFPGAFTESSTDLFNGWRRGGIAVSDLAQFAIRGLLPRPVVRALIDMKTRRGGASVVNRSR